MNQVLRDAAQQTDHTWLIGVVTAVFLLLFLSYVLWVYSARSKEFFEEASQLPFDDDDEDA